MQKVKILQVVYGLDYSPSLAECHQSLSLSIYLAVDMKNKQKVLSASRGAYSSAALIKKLDLLQPRLLSEGVSHDTLDLIRERIWNGIPMASGFFL